MPNLFFRLRRPVLHAALEIVDQELIRLQQAGEIQLVNYSEWSAPIVVITKASGTVWADSSTGLSTALDVYQYPLSVPKNLFAELNGGAYFAKIDFSADYLQVKILESWPLNLIDGYFITSIHHLASSLHLLSFSEYCIRC